MGLIQSCSCKNTTIAKHELAISPRERLEEAPIQLPIQDLSTSVEISGPQGLTKIVRWSQNLSSSEIQSPPRQKKQNSQISRIEAINSHQSCTLTINDFVLPQHVTKALIKLGEYILDSKLVEMFQDCPQIMFTNLDENGEFYLGQKSHGIRTGFGKVLYFDKSYYEGFWINNERNFNGRFVDKDGDAYVGEWFSNQMNGIGKFIHHDGTIFDTMQGMNEKLRNEIIMKSPAQIYPDGKLYYGQLSGGKKNGLGLFILSDKSEYFGHYNVGKRQGYGIMEFEDGRKYEGTWNNGTMHGFGKFTWPNSQLFIGIYHNDVKDGYGMFIWPDGCKYRGMFKNGLMNGIGRVVDNEGRISEGEWINGDKIKSSSLRSPGKLNSDQRIIVNERNKKVNVGNRSQNHSPQTYQNSPIKLTRSINLEINEEIEVIRSESLIQASRLSQQSQSNFQQKKQIDDKKKILQKIIASKAKNQDNQNKPMSSKQVVLKLKIPQSSRSIDGQSLEI